LIELDEFELNSNPDNFFTEFKQAAFNPAYVVAGIGLSPDKMLQARPFSYGNAQRYRLGVNHHQIPVNAPRRPGYTATIATAPCARMATSEAASATSRIATASGKSSQISMNRR
jgi:catalase